MSLRARRAGDAFDVEIKLQRRYDEEERLGTPQRVMEWINAVLSGTAPPCQSYEWRDIQNHLKDGVVLCRLINKLLSAVGLPTITYRAKVPSSFVAMSNIEIFNNAARQYGVSETSLFQTTDLYEGRKGNMIHVIMCLNQLGQVANSRGFQPRYEGVPPPKPDWTGTDDVNY